MNAILNFSIEEKLEELIKDNLNNIKLFFIIFIVNILIYGQKLFFYTLATDDYSRFYSGGGEQASHLGRWMAGIINQNIFTEALHILPYFNSLLGVFSLTLAGFLTAKFLKRSNAFEIFIVTLLISVTPMLTHNLYFNTNISTWISTLLGVVGLLLAYKSSNITKIFGFMFLVGAIGCYQTIIQVTIAMIFTRTIIDIMEAEDNEELKRIILNAAFFIIFVLFAFVASSFINYLYMEYNNLEVANRLKKVGTIAGLSVYIERILFMYYRIPSFQYFKYSFVALYATMTFFATFAAFIAVFKSKQSKNTRIISVSLLVLLFLTIPIVVNLPIITGTRIPFRAHYTIGWFMAGFFVMQAFSFTGLFRTITTLIAMLIIILSVYYTNIYFDAGNRQTNADIARANQIVNRIRTHENYTTDPLKYKIIGKKSFPVIGWTSTKQALNRDWSKYNIFKNFTDLKFDKMNDKEYGEITDLIVEKGKKINSYPAKNSIIVYRNKVILFLDSYEINARIAKNK